LVDLVLDGELLGQMLHRGEAAVLHADGRVEYAPGVLVEIAADHLAEFGPLEERVVASVRAHEALAVLLDKREQVLTLLIAEAFAGTEIEDRVEVIEVARIAGRWRDGLLGDELRIGAQKHLVGAALPP